MLRGLKAFGKKDTKPAEGTAPLFHRQAKQVLPHKANGLCLSEFPHKELVLHALPLDRCQNKFRQFIGPMETMGGLCACSSARKGANVTNASLVRFCRQFGYSKIMSGSLKIGGLQGRQ